MAFTCLMRDISILWCSSDFRFSVCHAMIIWFRVSTRKHTQHFTFCWEENTENFPFLRHKPHTLGFRHWFRLPPHSAKKTFPFLLTQLNCEDVDVFTFLMTLFCLLGVFVLLGICDFSATTLWLLGSVCTYTTRNWVNQIPYNAH